MAEIDDLDIVDASNTARQPEGVAAGQVNDGIRALEGLLARGFKDAVEGDRDSTGSANAYLVAANRTISAYYDGMRQGFHANFGNTGAATLDIDSVGAKTIKKLHDQDLASGDIETNQYVEVVYSATDDTFQMLSGVANASTTSPLTAVLDTGGFAIDESEGTAVASASTTDIWVTDGNTVHITGSGTITSFGTAPRIGAWRKCIADGAFTLIDGANLNLPGGANITAAVDDFFFVYAETTTLFKVLYFKVDGTAVGTQVATIAEMEAATNNTAFVSPLRAGKHPGAAKFRINFNGTGVIAINDEFGVTTIQDNGVGDYTISFDTAFSSANWQPAGMTIGIDTSVAIAALSTTNIQIRTFTTSTGAAIDLSVISVLGFGDQ